MQRVTFALMRRTVRMLVLAGIAIVVGTAFISATFLFGGSLQDMLSQSLAAPYGSATHVVAASDSAASDSQSSGSGSGVVTLKTVRAMAKVPGVSAVRAECGQRIIIRKGRHAATSLGEPMALEAAGSSAESGEKLMPLRLQDGTWPKAGQIALSSSTAHTLGVRIGEKVGIAFAPLDGSGNDAAPGVRPHMLTVSGIADDPKGTYAAMGGASVLPIEAFPADSAQTAIGTVYLAMSPQAVSSVRALVPAGWKLATREAAIHQQVLDQSGGRDAVQIFLLIFGILALLVAALVIANTFQVIVAHRRRTLALLRAVGAQKSQLYGSVVEEAGVLGLVSSAIGVGFACLLMWILSVIPAVSVGFMNGATLHFVPSAAAFVVPLAFGVLVTILASLSAAHAATSVTPLEALRSMSQVPTRKAGAVRAVFSVLLLLGGAALTALSYSKMTAPKISNSDFETYLLVGIAACALLFVGLSIGAVWWMPVFMRFSCWVSSQVGPSSKIAAANILRNPRRIAATGTALLIGVTLVTTMATGAATMNATAGKKLDAHYSVDIAVSSVSTLTAKDLAAIRQAKGVQSARQVRRLAAQVRKGAGSLSDESVPVYALTNAERRSVMRGTDLSAPAGIAVVTRSDEPALRGVRTGERITLDLGNGTALPLTARCVSFSLPGVSSAVLVDPADIPAGAPAASGTVIWARVNPTADGRKVMDSLQHALAGSGETQILRPIAERQEFEQEINQILFVLVALLAVSVLIALIGVANTLSLSVIERTHESATLRAIGMTKGQLRASLAVEALIISVTSSLAGLAVGAFFGWFGSLIVLKNTFGESIFQFDWRMALIIIAISIVTALISSVAPARRAVRTSPVEVLSEA